LGLAYEKMFNYAFRYWAPLKKVMINGKTFATVLDKLLTKSEVAQNARIQVQMPNGDLHDITEIKLMENMLIGPFETHRLVLVTEPQKHKMSKVIRSSQIV
jgi:hypothetical protein